MGYASMIQEFAEKNVKPYHLADTIEVEEVGPDGKKRVRRVVNYGYAELGDKALEIQERGGPADEEEQRLVEYFNAVAGQFKGRMNRTGANRFLNALRAADINVQFADADTAARTGFPGEDYGDMHAQGKIITSLLGVPHATHLRNRRHELQLRGVIPFGAKGEDIAPEKYSLERAASAAAVNPAVMNIFLNDQTVATRLDIIKRALDKIDGDLIRAPKENADRLRELMKYYYDKNRFPDTNVVPPPHQAGPPLSRGQTPPFTPPPPPSGGGPTTP
jgi:hypothetical protein